MRTPRVVAIGGSDPGGGAGIQADLKTFTALKVYGMSVVTAVTVQDTRGVREVARVSPGLAARQLAVSVGDIGADVAKTGMLGGPAMVGAIAATLRALRVRKIVVDPVMAAKDGTALLDPRARTALVGRLLPLALLVTPNVQEAEVLAGSRIRTQAELRSAARRIAALGPKCVLVKGGHLPGPVCRDLLYCGGVFQAFEAARVRTKNTHGTGCTLAAAVAAFLARGEDVAGAVRSAKRYVTGAVEHALALGEGRGPLNHYWELP